MALASEEDDAQGRNGRAVSAEFSCEEVVEEEASISG